MRQCVKFDAINDRKDLLESARVGDQMALQTDMNINMKFQQTFETYFLELNKDTFFIAIITSYELL